MQKKSSGFLRNALCATLALISTASFAEDGKVYPATFCQGALVGNPPIISYDGPRLTNTSTTNKVLC